MRCDVSWMDILWRMVRDRCTHYWLIGRNYVHTKQKRNRRVLTPAPVSDRTLLEDSARLCTSPIACDTTLKEWKFKSFQLADHVIYWRKYLCRGFARPRLGNHNSVREELFLISIHVVVSPTFQGL
jgi:hypothetical protein